MPWTMTRQQIPNPAYIPWVTGRFYQTPFARAVTTGAAILTSLTAAPIYVPNPAGVTATTLGLEVTSGGTSSAMRLGIYSVSADGQPSALLYDSGSISTTGTGFLSVSPSVKLRQGWYMLANAHSGGAAPTIRVGGGVWSAALGNIAPSGTTVTVQYSAVNLGASAVADIVTNGLPGHYPLANTNLVNTNISRVLVGI